MNADSVTITVLEPTGKLAEGEAEYVELPVEGGDMAVYPGHTSAVCGLRPGHVRISSSDLPELLAISGGYCEIVRTPSAGAGEEGAEGRLHSRVTVCARTAEQPSEIDHARAREAERRALDRLTQPAPDIDLARARAALARARARLSVIGGGDHA